MATPLATRQPTTPAMRRTSHPGVYRRGTRYVAVYRVEGRQHKESAPTFAQARAIKLAREVEAREQAAGPMLHAYALDWVAGYPGCGHDAIGQHTRVEYHRLLSTFVLKYFPSDLAVGDVDRDAVQAFVQWLARRPGRRCSRLSDQSIHNALTPLRRCLDTAISDGLLTENPAFGLVLPRRRAGGPWRAREERRFLTRNELRRLLAEIPDDWQVLFDLLAATGLRISEAIALRWSDLTLDTPAPRLFVRRAIVSGVVGSPKSRHGVRAIPITPVLAAALAGRRPEGADEDDLVFSRPGGQPVRPDYLRAHVLKPAALRAGVPPCGLHTFRHTCAALLIAAGASPLQLQRWMGHHSAAYTLEAYGHLIDGHLGPALDLAIELAQPVP